MPFSPADLLDADTATRLRTIVFYQMRLDLMGNFAGLLTSEKRKFNETMNSYIQSLSDEGWEKELIDEFNEIVLKKILNESFDASKAYCADVNPDTQHCGPTSEEKEER